MSAKVSSFSQQVNELVTDLNQKVTDSDVVKFIAKHENVLNTLSLLAADLYCIKDSPVTLITSFLATAIKPEYVDALTAKICNCWNEHPQAQPFIVAGAITATTLTPGMVLSTSCGYYSAQRLNTQPVTLTWRQKLSDWLWSTATSKRD